MIRFRETVLNELAAIKRELSQLTAAISGRSQQSSANIQTMEKAMTDIRSAVDSLASKVEGQRTVIESVTSLLQGLKDQVLQAQGDLDAVGEVDAANKLAELAAAIDANTDKLAKAAASNTDAGDEVHAANM
jgi:chromosome segregation ATPase